MNTVPHPNERLAKLEQRLDTIEEEYHHMSQKVDEMHAVLMKARGVRWAIVVVVGVVAFFGGVLTLFSTLGALTHWRWS